MSLLNYVVVAVVIVMFVFVIDYCSIMMMLMFHFDLDQPLLPYRNRLLHLLPFVVVVVCNIQHETVNWQLSYMGMVHNGVPCNVSGGCRSQNETNLFDGRDGDGQDAFHRMATFG